MWGLAPPRIEEIHDLSLHPTLHFAPVDDYGDSILLEHETGIIVVRHLEARPLVVFAKPTIHARPSWMKSMTLSVHGHHTFHLHATSEGSILTRNNEEVGKDAQLVYSRPSAQARPIRAKPIHACSAAHGRIP